MDLVCLRFKVQKLAPTPQKNNEKIIEKPPKEEKIIEKTTQKKTKKFH